MDKLCFDCLNSTSGMCAMHTKNLEAEYVDYTTTIASMTKDDQIEVMAMEIKELERIVKKQNRRFHLLLVSLPIILMAMILLVKTNVIFFIGFIVCWYYADSFNRKIKLNSFLGEKE